MKTIIWETNFNGKLSCQRFPHIDLAPAKMPTHAELEAADITIKVADGSHPPVQVKIDSIIPLMIGELSNIHTWPSHGMSTADFLNWQHIRTPIKQDTMLAVYYYKKPNTKHP